MLRKITPILPMLFALSLFTGLFAVFTRGRVHHIHVHANNGTCGKPCDLHPSSPCAREPHRYGACKCGYCLSK